jgi:hypothetical protein
MIVAQAAAAFAWAIGAASLEAAGIDRTDAYERALRVMAGAW